MEENKMVYYCVRCRGSFDTMEDIFKHTKDQHALATLAGIKLIKELR